MGLREEQWKVSDDLFCGRRFIHEVVEHRCPTNSLCRWSFVGMSSAALILYLFVAIVLFRHRYCALSAVTLSVGIVHVQTEHKVCRTEDRMYTSSYRMAPLKDKTGHKIYSEIDYCCSDQILHDVRSKREGVGGRCFSNSLSGSVVVTSPPGLFVREFRNGTKACQSVYLRDQFGRHQTIPLCS